MEWPSNTGQRTVQGIFEVTSETADQLTIVVRQDEGPLIKLSPTFRIEDLH